MTRGPGRAWRASLDGERDSVLIGDDHHLSTAEVAKPVAPSGAGSERAVLVRGRQGPMDCMGSEKRGLGNKYPQDSRRKSEAQHGWADKTCGDEEQMLLVPYRLSYRNPPSCATENL